jgi:hypothetical protein
MNVAKTLKNRNSFLLLIIDDDFIIKTINWLNKTVKFIINNLLLKNQSIKSIDYLNWYLLIN